jgi:hypothetical protein
MVGIEDELHAENAAGNVMDIRDEQPNESSKNRASAVINAGNAGGATGQQWRPLAENAAGYGFSG